MTQRRRWCFRTGWQKLPLSMNDRLHHMQKAQITRVVRNFGAVCGREVGVLEKCRVELVWFVHDQRRRDAENVVATLKPFCDGLVDVGVVPDDTPGFMEKVMPRIEFDKGRDNELVFYVTDIGEDK